MTQKIPIKLNQEPLIEAVWEMRFQLKESFPGEALFGIVYKRLSDRFPQVVRLPAADIPSFVGDHEPKFKYLPKIRMMGENRAVQIGNYVVSLSNRRPYVGWKEFSKDIQELLKVLQESDILLRVERISLKYLDLVELGEEPSLKCLNLQFKIGETEIDTRPVHLWTKIEEEKIVHIVGISSPAEVRLPGEPSSHRGVLLDIDSIRPFQKDESWEEQVETSLEILHDASKRIFSIY